MNKHHREATTTASRIWQAVAAIPYGRVASYGQVASMAGLPGAARRVGSVLKNLPPDSRLPWHRVVRANGELAFAVDSDSYCKQRQRLRDENITMQGRRIPKRFFINGVRVIDSLEGGC